MHYLKSKVRHETKRTAARQTLSRESKGLNAVEAEVLHSRSQLEKHVASGNMVLSQQECFSEKKCIDFFML